MRRLIIALLSVAMSACADNSTSPTGPAGVPTVPIPALTDVVPNVGSTSGGTPVVITGAGLLPGVTVTFDGTTVPARFDTRFRDRIFLDTPAHVAGTLDVVVTNVGGQPGRLAAGYTYVPTQSFDFNGTWWGYPYDGSDLPLEFTIRNDGLVSVTCGPTTLALPEPVAVTDGRFSFSRNDVAMSGTIVSESQAAGAIKLAPCNAPLWKATRKP
jgi:hypothetical protein